MLESLISLLEAKKLRKMSRARHTKCAIKIKHVYVRAAAVKFTSLLFVSCVFRIAMFLTSLGVLA